MTLERFNALLEAAKDGDEGAWAEIFRELAAPVLGYLRSSRAPDPDDALGEVFLQVARDVKRFEGDERQFRAWVFTVAHHRLIDARRHSARRPVDLVPEPPEPAGGGDDAAEEALARIGAEEIRRVLKALTQEQQTVLLLRVIGDLTVEEVAKAVGKRAGAVKALQRRGLAAVRRELAEKRVTL
jgi:RNA polymerase sigma factor (sigma-70 family)